jgi:hypothetical protein
MTWGKYTHIELHDMPMEEGTLVECNYKIKVNQAPDTPDPVRVAGVMYLDGIGMTFPSQGSMSEQTDTDWTTVGRQGVVGPGNTHTLLIYISSRGAEASKAIVGIDDLKCFPANQQCLDTAAPPAPTD